jgi:N-acetylmuramic acid 6-phosphate (MurNAc-6-P) etherase
MAVERSTHNPFTRPAPEARDNVLAPGAGQVVSAIYLRAAQAYMLISMPTGTSTIFGVFQAIEVPPNE